MSESKEHWEKVYRCKSPEEVSWYQQEPNLSLSLIERASLPDDAPIIDIGGGASSLVDHLCERGYSNISVLDISANALAHAKNRLGHQADKVHWYEEDVTNFEPAKRFALWHDRAVFHFLTSKADRERYMQVLQQTLEPGAHLVIMTFAVGGPKKCSGLDVVQYDSDKMSMELGSGFELLETGYDHHSTPVGGLQKFAYFHFRAVTLLN
jgi:SAM-dependent methyltransferase